MTSDEVTATGIVRGNHNGLELYPLPSGVTFERDVLLTMRDGVRLAANVFRPEVSGEYPVLLAISPYGKDDYTGFRIFSKFDGSVTGDIRISDHTAFEAPDPGYWVPRGYVVIQVDVRGQGNSEGDTNTISAQEQEDYCEIIAWAAAQSWSNGKVGLHGVSYLAITQWFVAQHRPPALKAIVPWEGWTEPYGRAFFEGIHEVGFREFVLAGQIIPAHNPACGFQALTAADLPSAHPTRDDFWKARSPELEKINVPALICASCSDQGLHSRDSFVAFERIGSSQKWLYNHRQPKWNAYYSAEAYEIQQRFLDHFLKGTASGILETPTVRYQINEDRDTFTVHHSEQWPPRETTQRALSLDPISGLLSEGEVATSGAVEYDAASGSARFRYRFDRDTVVIGNMALRIWMEAVGADDMDLFVGVRKYNRAGEQVYFYGFSGQNSNDCVARGWLRASHRALDPLRTTAIRPWHSHETEELLEPGAIVPVDIEILPSATLYRVGEELEVVIQGHPLPPDAPMLRFEGLRNSGIHRIHAGGVYDAHILLGAFDWAD